MTAKSPSAPKFGRRTGRAHVQRLPGWGSAGIAALLCSGVAWASLPRPAEIRTDEQRQWHALGIAPLSGGGSTGMRMSATDAVEPVDFVPKRAIPAIAAEVADAPKVKAGPLRIRGRVGDGLYWSLRAAGATPQSAAEYLQALATEIDVGSDVGPDDRFDLVIAGRRAATGERKTGPLLYAAIDRSADRDLQLVKWTSNGRAAWVDAADIARPTAAAMAWPVAGRITSGFGYRVHPILRFARLHKGVDFGAGWGSPIAAAADGQVTAAGWAGGYGRQVRIVHAGGLATSYSHMSRIIAEPGSIVRRGDLIGYVGSSGLSTGPHLHYEVYRGGQAVNPLSVRFAGAAAVDQRQVVAFKARLKALLSVGVRSGT